MFSLWRCKKISPIRSMVNYLIVGWGIKASDGIGWIMALYTAVCTGGGCPWEDEEMLKQSMMVL